MPDVQLHLRCCNSHGNLLKSVLVRNVSAFGITRFLDFVQRHPRLRMEKAPCWIWGLHSDVMKNFIFWHIKSCSALRVDRGFWRKMSPPSSKWKNKQTKKKKREAGRNLSFPKYRLTFNGLHVVISHKTESCGNRSNLRNVGIPDSGQTSNPGCYTSFSETFRIYLFEFFQIKSAVSCYSV
jgi:hypothetical protein